MGTMLSEKIEFLFETFRKRDGKRFTYQEVADGVDVTPPYIWKLHTGRSTNPSHKVLQAMSDFFGVPITYFSEESMSEERAENLKLARELRDTGVMRIALRASDLDEDGKRAVLEMIEYIRKAQGLINGSEES